MTRSTPARIARDAFAEGAISLLRRALAEGLGAHVLVDPHGAMTHADLYDATGAVLVHLTLGEPRAAQLALPLAGPVEAAVPLTSQPPPAPAVEAHPLAIGDRIILHGVAVEILGVDDEGFLWREVDPDAVALDEGETLWRDVVRVAGDVWMARKIDEAPVEEPPPAPAPKPAKKPRAKKAPAKAVEAPAAHPRAVLGRWTLVEGYTDGTDDEVYSWPNEANARDMMANAREADICTHATLIDPRGVVVDTYTAAAAPVVETDDAAPWRLVEHPIGAPPHEERHEEPVARRLYSAVAAHGEGLRRLELFDGGGLLVDSHTWPVPSQPTRGLDGVPDTVPAHLRDAVALTSPDWWCVVTECAFRPEDTAVQLCADGGTAASAAVAHRAGHDATRVVVVTPEGDVGDVWHRYEPATVAAVEANPDAELFRVGVAVPDAFTDVAAWVQQHGLAWYAATFHRNTVAEVREGTAWLHWWRMNSEATAIIPRAFVAFVSRRAASKGFSITVEPWTSTTNSNALRVGSRVDLRGEEWRVFSLPDHETATLTRDPDEIAEVALAELHPSGTGHGWWAERVKPKAEKKAPKRAKGGA